MSETQKGLPTFRNWSAKKKLLKKGNVSPRHMTRVTNLNLMHDDQPHPSPSYHFSVFVKAPFSKATPMSILTTITTRLATTLANFIRTAVRHLGFGPVVLAATAAAALLYSLRRRTPPDTQRNRRTRSSRVANNNSNARSQHRLPLGDRAHQWLSRVRRVTVGAKWTLGESCQMFQRHPDTNQVTLVDAVVPHLKRFAAHFDVYFVVRVDSDEAEVAVMNALTSAGMFESGLLDRRKVLFCETDVGRVSVARQLEPHLHIDETIDVIVGLQRFVHFVAWVAADAKSKTTEKLAPNVVRFTSLSSFFTARST